MEKISFKELFDDGRYLVIPKIQRDYAQGRKSMEEIRNNFIGALYDALLDGAGINLDFIYGSIEIAEIQKTDNDEDEKEKVISFVPLDGQQRLTTLYLLYWLVSRREDKKEESLFLKRFSYETRYTTRLFCEFLNDTFEPEFNQTLSEEIKDDSEYLLSWERDPSVRGMKRMLDALDEKFYRSGVRIDNLWEKLDKITFLRETLDNLGSTDDIYIKMNSRGKPLTRFEHFKAELDSVVSDDLFAEKMDTVWTDIFWNIREESDNIRELPIVDDAILRYIRFIADTICYKKNGEPAPVDDFDMIRDVYSSVENQRILSESMDCLKDLDTDEFFDAIFSDEDPRCETQRVNIGKNTNLFKELCHGGKWTVRDSLLLMSCILYLRNRLVLNPDAFARRIRIIRNLAFNSPDEFRPERYSSIFSETESIILDGTINLASNSFNQAQKEEEQRKLDWLAKADLGAEKYLVALENNGLLYGSTQLFDICDADVSAAFGNLFNSSSESCSDIARALLTYGDISYRENYWRVLIPGNNQEIWRNYFQPKGNADFCKRASAALSALLEDFMSGKSCRDIIERWLDSESTEKDWRFIW